jgi:SAM-dependent methyltransferase
MLLTRLLGTLLRANKPAAAPAAHSPEAPRLVLDPARQQVLDVGGGHRDNALPPHYAAWQRLMLDVDPKAAPDILLDARRLRTLPAAQFDAVYCSHNLEHYHEHEVAQVLAGFAHVLKSPDGFVEIRVPDVHAIAVELATRGRALDDTLYTSPAGPIRVIDVLYGYGRAIEQSGVDFYAHKTGFTRATLRRALEAAGFEHAYRLAPIGVYEIRSVALRGAPGALHRELFGIDARSEAL